MEALASSNMDDMPLINLIGKKKKKIQWLPGALRYISSLPVTHSIEVTPSLPLCNSPPLHHLGLVLSQIIFQSKSGL